MPQVPNRWLPLVETLTFVLAAAVVALDVLVWRV